MKKSENKKNANLLDQLIKYNDILEKTRREQERYTKENDL